MSEKLASAEARQAADKIFEIVKGVIEKFAIKNGIDCVERTPEQVANTKELMAGAIADSYADITRRNEELQAELNSANKRLVEVEKLATTRLAMQTVYYDLRQEMYRMAEEARTKWEAAERLNIELVEALERIKLNDKTRYRHHEPRPSDWKKPSEVGDGTIFNTPKEIAEAAIKSATPKQGEVGR